MALLEEESYSDKRADSPKAKKRNIADAMSDLFSKNQVHKVIFSVVLATLAFVRFYYYEALSRRMDVVFLFLVLSVFLVWLIPWEQLWQRLGGLSVGGVGISLQQPDVQAAIAHISFDEKYLRIIGAASEKQVRERLQRRLESLEGIFQTLRGSRVLWIDDHPHTILGERRLLRALGIDITPAMSSEEAQNILEKDNDFDLIITDVYRVGRDEGVDFVVKLHKNKDERIGSLPVIFYAAYRWGDLVKRTLPARELRPEVEISNAVDEFIPKVIRRLSEERINPIIVSSKKIPATPEERAAADRGFSE